MKRWNVNTSVEKLREHIEFLIKNIKKDNIKIEYSYTPWVQLIYVDIFVEQIKTRGYKIFLAEVRNRDRGSKSGYDDFKELSNTLIKMAR